MLFLRVVSVLCVPVPLPCFADFRVELEREARVGPVAGCVFMAPAGRFWPLPAVL
jgi:hypothetical protein